MKSSFLTNFLWGVYPYLCITLFLAVPVIRMIYRPFGFSTRATSLFNRNLLGVASLPLHWGILLVFVAHLAGFIGGLLGLEGWITFFRWAGLIGGFLTLFGCIVALARRFAVPEVRAMSQWDDYWVHGFLVALLTLGLYQVVVDKIFGVAYTASSWLASVAQFNPQPELMASASLISKWHVFLALTFFAVFPFTKLVHFWTFPINYFVRPYQSMRTDRFKSQRRWEFALRSDKSFLTYSLAALVVFFGGFSLLLGYTKTNGLNKSPKPILSWTTGGRLAGMPLYISQCARCHGLHGDGQGQGAESPTFATLPRDLTAAKFAFISTDNGIASDADLARAIRYGLVPAGMPAFAELDDDQVASLVVIVRGFTKQAGEAPGNAIAVPPCPPQASVERGRELFQQGCAPCHGLQGRGDGPNVGTLRDFAGRRLQPRDLANPQAYKVGTQPEQIYLRVAAGTPPTMPAFQGTFPPQDLWSIVKFVEAELLSGKLARQMAATPAKSPSSMEPKKPEKGAGSFE
ncbi:MAG: respiratory nitrate reductase subunit gamma [Verrucomicrobia bacterium]|nr:respiratory nitrate reductase subunit gamma [Verrucomicrobiota bacterium]